MKGKGIVISLDGDKAKIRVTSETECSGCASKTHCHSGENHPRNIVVLNDFGAKISDNVVFEAAMGKVILSAALIWIMPILSMIVGYYIADRFAGGAWPILAAFLFLGLSFVFLKMIDNVVSGGRTFYPRISRILKATESLTDFCHN